MRALPNRPIAVSLISLSFLCSLGRSSFCVPIRPQLLAIEAPMHICEASTATAQQLLMRVGTECEWKREMRNDK